jgi:hypothetical protein
MPKCSLIGRRLVMGQCTLTKGTPNRNRESNMLFMALFFLRNLTGRYVPKYWQRWPGPVLVPSPTTRHLDCRSKILKKKFKTRTMNQQKVELESSNPLARTRPKTCFIQVSVMNIF